MAQTNISRDTTKHRGVEACDIPLEEHHTIRVCRTMKQKREAHDHQTRSHHRLRTLCRTTKHKGVRVEASDKAATHMELIVNILITGIVVASVTSLIAMALQFFGVEKDSNLSPHRTVQRELARTAERMLIEEKCANPDNAKSHLDCLERVEISFPKPAAPVPRPHDPDYDPICWIVESRGTDDATDTSRQDSYTGEDPRDLECWNHDPDQKQIVAWIYHPETTKDTKNDYLPVWNDKSYSHPLIATGIERLGYCTNNDGTMSGRTKTDCTTGFTWHRGWGCVAGINTRPRSAVLTAPTFVPIAETDCDPTTAFNDGVAVLTLRICVSLSQAELRQRTSENDRFSDYPLTCNGKNITVTPGHK